MRFILVSIFLWLAVQDRSLGHSILVGTARIDVTPEYPIRMGGYAVRKIRSTGVEQRLWAKALSIKVGESQPIVLITLDNVGLAEQTYRQIADRLQKNAGLTKDRFAIAQSHTHTGPLTSFKAPNLFVEDIPAEDLEIIDRYSKELIGKIEQAARESLRQPVPVTLLRGEGKVDFAQNRRGRALKPVDHSVPVIVAKDSAGKVVAVIANYACHCTTLGGVFTRMCGDWAAYAQESLEQAYGTAVALVTIGCGADANPHPREGSGNGLELSKKHGAALAAEVQKVLAGPLSPIHPDAIRTELRELELPFARHFTREEWTQRSQSSGIVGYHAKKNLARLDRGEELPKTLYYPIVTWSFGKDFHMVFLPGEVVVDYALRLRSDHPSVPLWITAYANYVPCYIPSRRILSEGGYEAEDSLWYYDRPARLSSEVEDLIHGTVQRMIR